MPSRLLNIVLYWPQYWAQLMLHNPIELEGPYAYAGVNIAVYLGCQKAWGDIYEDCGPRWAVQGGKSAADRAPQNIFCLQAVTF